MKPQVLLQSDLPLPLLHRGKVRDVYHATEDLLLLLATDRVSAFDVVMAEAVPEKGRVLTQITAWWLATHLSGTPHHLVSTRTADICRAVPALTRCTARWEGRASLVRRTRPLPVECVVRGCLAGSAWKEYRESETLAGEPLPSGLVENAHLDPPVFSPATKAREGHDENISFSRAADLLGDDLAAEVRRRSLALFAQARAAARERGILLADTKFEFGNAPGGTVLLIDEAITPDSSRFWPVRRGNPNRGQASLDKQPIRDYLSAVPGWNRRPPPPALPPAVTEAASDRYLEVFRQLTGTRLHDFEPPEFAT